MQVQNALLILMATFFGESSYSQDKKNKLKSFDKKSREALADELLKDELSEKMSPNFFPDWSRPSLHYTIRPIAGAVYSENTSLNEPTIKSLDSEFGAGASIDNIPLFEDHPDST